MSDTIRKKAQRQKRQRRVMTKVRSAARDRNILTVFRSARHIYASFQEPGGRTLFSVSTLSKELREPGATGGNLESAKKVGKLAAQKAIEKGFTRVVFNRNGFLYHGRVKALAEAAREAGLQF